MLSLIYGFEFNVNKNYLPIDKFKNKEMKLFEYEKFQIIGIQIKFPTEKIVNISDRNFPEIEKSVHESFVETINIILTHIAENPEKMDEIELPEEIKLSWYFTYE